MCDGLITQDGFMNFDLSWIRGETSQLYYYESFAWIRWLSSESADASGKERAIRKDGSGSSWSDYVGTKLQRKKEG